MLLNWGNFIIIVVLSTFGHGPPNWLFPNATASSHHLLDQSFCRYQNHAEGQSQWLTSRVEGWQSRGRNQRAKIHCKEDKDFIVKE